MDRAVCLLSGGMDSCVATGIAVRRGFDVAVLHGTYGQTTEDRELRAAMAVADHYGVLKRRVVSLRHLSEIGGSALTDPLIPIPEGDLNRDGVPPTYVPFRNANLLSVAVSWAEVLGARFIYIGVVQEDGSGYPDCTDLFLRAFNHLISTGTKPGTEIEVVAPVLHMRKADIVREGMKLRAPLHLTWSCYRSNDPACGTCDSCLLRLRGFREAGFPDPIRYAVPV